MKKIFLCVAICGLLLVVFSSCDNDIVIVRYDFGQYPRLVYVVNVDTELDFTGATIFYTLRNGFQEDEHPFVLGDWVSIEHSIDFTTPGEYNVRLIMHGHSDPRLRTPSTSFPITFTVQVVDEETYMQLNEGER